MSKIVYTVLILIVLVIRNDAARILAVYPTPSISHQVVYRTLTLELLRRGHEIVVITTDPMFSKNETPANLTEIDVHDISYGIWRTGMAAENVIRGNSNDYKFQLKTMMELLSTIAEQQMYQKEVQNLLKGNQKFDLLIHEAIMTSSLIFSHIYQIPSIQISSLGAPPDALEFVGAPMHPFLYPAWWQHKVYNLTWREKLSEFIKLVNNRMILAEHEVSLDVVLKKVFGSNVPQISELKNYIDLVFVNVYPFWEMNRPVPPNFIYLGGLHQLPEKELPKDLISYLDSSKNGVIYVSFGTNVDPATLPPQKIQALINVFSKLPYDILWKWNHDELPGRTENIKISKWLPQADLLRHPKIKMFITQGGLQSTDEAITAGVPLIGMPMLGDQWYNVEHYIHHGIGVRVDMDTIDEEKFGNAVNEILNNESYRRNMERLRDLVNDQPQTSLERAVWWTEYVIRHRGAKHLRSPAANISWAEYLELELVFYLLVAISSVILALIFLLCKLVRIFKSSSKQKTN